MILRPCIECGEVTEHARCAEHTVCAVKVPPPKGHVHSNPARWKALSLRVRRAMPFCLDCGATEHLECDHVVPVSVRPEWAYELANLTTRCAHCNGLKSDTMPSAQVVREIEDRIAARTLRNPGGRGRTVGGFRPWGEAKFPSLTPGGIPSGSDPVVSSCSTPLPLLRGREKGIRGQLGQDGLGILDGEPPCGGELDPLPLAVVHREHVAVEEILAPLARVRDHFAVGERHHEVSHDPSLP